MLDSTFYEMPPVEEELSQRTLLMIYGCSTFVAMVITGFIAWMCIHKKQNSRSQQDKKKVK